MLAENSTADLYPDPFFLIGASVIDLDLQLHSLHHSFSEFQIPLKLKVEAGKSESLI